jgi:hypothetical protein
LILFFSVAAAAGGGLSGRRISAPAGIRPWPEVAVFSSTTPPSTILLPLYSGGNFPDAISLDTSLQLELAFTQCGQSNTSKAPATCKLGN